MRRSITRIIPLLLFPVLLQHASAQCVVRGWDSLALAKCDAHLRMLLALGSAQDDKVTRKEGTGTAARSARDRLHLFMTGDPDRIAELVRRAGGTTGGIVGTLITATVPPDRLPAIASSDAVRRIELGSHVELFNDSVRASIRADQVHRGMPPLDDAYSGKGVILGFIDTGIDYRHPEFRDAHDSLTSRIIALWAQHGSGGAPPPTFGYGSEWSAAQIQSAIEGHGDPDFEMHDFIGHGTHVAATAAGLHGMAPDAQIIVVQLRDAADAWDDFAASVLDAAIYIYVPA
jgi:subtilisin family serine protease